MTDIKDNKKWFAIYVKSRCEKKVHEQLDDIGVESFLPLITKVKQWSDRKKKVEEPLFRSYLFVHISDNDYYNVLNVSGVVKFISFERKAVEVPGNQITAIKRYISDTDLHDIELDNVEFKEGEMVRIKSGQMKDLIGRFVTIKGKHRVIIDIEVVGQSLPVNIARSNIEAVK